MGFKIKKILAWIFHVLGISNFMLNRLNKQLNGQYIRIVNYHNTPEENAIGFEKQLQWYQAHYSNVSYQEFEDFLSGASANLPKPGLMITFDDGYKGNYDVALPLLEKYGFTGYFMCSSDLVGREHYMDFQQLKDMLQRGHIVGDHTATHHRMLESDSVATLNHEILESKQDLEKGLDSNVDIFCWCGGEEVHYTKKAYDAIKKAGYKYAFMTNSTPVTQTADYMHIQRINVEDNWPIYLVKLQVCGFMDKRFEAKRNRVDSKLKGNEGSSR